MNLKSRIGACAFGALVLVACSSSRGTKETPVMSDGLVSEVRISIHQGEDDLLSAGLGLAGLRGEPARFADPERPTASELRRRAIYTSWRGIADLGPLGGYGEIYGAVPLVSGREFTAFARLPGATSAHRVLVQVPDLFDREKRCVIVAASSGSRGIYGAISLAGAWGLPRGCAVAYTDKGAGSGYFDVASETGVRLDGTRAQRGSELLEFDIEGDGGNEPAGTNQVLFKHAHSGDNPESSWGGHVMQAAHFALRALDQALPAQAPFTAENTRIFALGLSNGGGAVLRAAEIDEGLLDGVVAVEPNIWAGEGGRALYDYATEAALLMPCALLDARFDSAAFARVNGQWPPAWSARCGELYAEGRLSGSTTMAQAEDALARMHASGWSDAVIESAATSTALDLWRAVLVTYAAAYAQTGVQEMPCGFGLAAMSSGGMPHPATQIERAAWWADATGIAPGAGVGISDSLADGNGRALPGLLCLSQLWSDSSPMGRRVVAGVAGTRARLPRTDLPMIIVHGTEDGFLPIAFSSDPYVRWIKANGRAPTYWRVGHAQHFDAFLAFPGFGDRYVPLMPYAYAAMDRLWAHVVAGEAMPPDRDIDATPRGDGPLGASQLGEIPGD